MGETSILPLPSVVAIMLADTIITEANTNKKSLVGVYSRIVTGSLPMEQTLNFYIELTDAQGEYEFDMELAYLEQDRALARGKIGPIIAKDRLHSLEMVIQIPARFAAFGSYEFRLVYNKKVIATRLFRVIAPQSLTDTSSNLPRN